MSDYDQALAISKALNRTRDPETMKALISRRRLVLASLEFQRAMERFEERNPVLVLRGSFPSRLG